MRISDWSSDVCSSDLPPRFPSPPACFSATTPHARPPTSTRSTPCASDLSFGGKTCPQYHALQEACAGDASHEPILWEPTLWATLRAPTKQYPNPGHQPFISGRRPFVGKKVNGRRYIGAKTKQEGGRSG